VDSDAVRDFYRRYLACCNDRRFADLAEFVDPEVRINGTDQGFDRYVAGLRAMVEPFPDYRWEVRHLLVDGDRLSAHFTDTGVHTGGAAPTGRAVDTQEFAVYRIAGGRIVEVWGAWVMAGSSVLRQLPGA
jgi:predicted ester cyclase